MTTRHADEKTRASRAFRAYVDLMDTADWLRERMSRQLETFDMTMMEFRVLETLHRKGPQYQQALSRKFRCSKQNVAHVVKRLEEEGWIWRGPGMLRPDVGQEAAVDVGPDAAAAATMEADGDSGEDQDAGPVPGRWIEKMKTYWERVRPRMFEALESSGKLHKAAVMAVVEMRAHLDAAAKEGQRIERAMEAARGQFWFLQTERDEEQQRQEAAKRAVEESVPEDMIPRIVEHWRRFSPETHARLHESGQLEQEARKAALQAQDAYLKMKSRTYNEEEAWEAARKHFPFMPGQDEDSEELAEVCTDAEPENENGDSIVYLDSEGEFRNPESADHADRADGVAEDEEPKNGDGGSGSVSVEVASKSSTQMADRPSLNTAGRPVVVIRLTMEGEALIANVFRKHAKVVKAQMRALEGREQQSLSKLCGKLRRGDMKRFVEELMMDDVEGEE